MFAHPAEAGVACAWAVEQVGYGLVAATAIYTYILVVGGATALPFTGSRSSPGPGTSPGHRAT